MLFLWATENQDIMYKQGMNEILAIVVFAFFAERVQVDTDFDSLTPEEIAQDFETLTSFIFDSRHTFADIYSTFNRILGFGIKNLYQETKDISELRNELVSIFDLFYFKFSLRRSQRTWKGMNCLHGSRGRKLKRRK